MELRSIKQYNPEYHKDGTLVWKRIGEKIGKHARKKKHYPQINISKIVVPNDIEIDDEILSRSRELYVQTQEMIPVYISFDFRLIGGYEQYALARELHMKKVPAQRVTKMNSTEKKTLSKAVSNQPIGNKKYLVRAVDGSKIFVTLRQKKKFNELLYQASCSGYTLLVLPDFSFSAKKIDGQFLFGAAKNGVSMSEARRLLRWKECELNE